MSIGLARNECLELRGREEDEVDVSVLVQKLTTNQGSVKNGKQNAFFWGSFFIESNVKSWGRKWDFVQ